jgi:hypothetical protein
MPTKQKTSVDEIEMRPLPPLPEDGTLRTGNRVSTTNISDNIDNLYEEIKDGNGKMDY